MRLAYGLLLLGLVTPTVPAWAQTAPPQPIQITASQGLEWQQKAELVIATGNAKAVRGGVTVTANQLIAHYRPKPGSASAPVASTPAALDTGSSEIYEIEAVGNVHIYTATDNAYGDHAVYQMDDALLVLTGKNLKLTTPQDVVTARDAIEYYAVKRVAVARGNALIVSSLGRSIAADTIIGHLAPTAPPAPGQAASDTAGMLDQAGALKKVDAVGHVVIRTSTETATGDTGSYLPGPGLARLGGHVHIIRGPNRLDGSQALVNMKTGIATLLAAPGGQVAGVIVPSAGAAP